MSERIMLTDAQRALRPLPSLGCAFLTCVADGCGRQCVNRPYMNGGPYLCDEHRTAQALEDFASCAVAEDKSPHCSCGSGDASQAHDLGCELLVTEGDL